MTFINRKRTEEIEIIKLTQLSLLFDNARTSALDCEHHFHSSERISQSWHIQRTGTICQRCQPSCSRRRLCSDVERRSERCQSPPDRTGLDTPLDSSSDDRSPNLQRPFSQVNALNPSDQLHRAFQRDLHLRLKQREKNKCRR